MKIFINSILLTLCTFFMLSSAASAQSKSVLIIESYHSEYPWDSSYIEGIKEGLKGDYQFFTFQMDTKRTAKSEFDNSAQKAWDFYLHTKPSIVFLGDDNALKYLGTKFSAVDTPVVFLGINNNPRAYKVGSATNITGVLERPLLKRSIIEMKKIVDLKKVLVLFDSGTTSKVTFDEILKGKDKIKLSGIEAHMKLIGSWEVWQETVKSAKEKGYDAVFIGLYHTIVDKNNDHIAADKVLQWTSENTPVPPFAFWDFSVGPEKAIGGLTLFGKTQGLLAAEMATQIISGTQPGQIKVRIGEKGKLLFSKTQLQKYNIELPQAIASKATLME
ncbi:ABC transporter substrate-binding protein [Psychromonas ossibalaenae]|uniref:ABC transporter substrate-binding protein n=1 Tax=Psychromonas ossibalaenae TaxID=444922 RepID=UPI0003774268|nr:ABC transporter substrate binding protein [Psychromonas ossibalaenae]